MDGALGEQYAEIVLPDPRRDNRLVPFEAEACQVLVVYGDGDPGTPARREFDVLPERYVEFIRLAEIEERRVAVPAHLDLRIRNPAGLEDDVELALLTGNYAAGAEIKLSHFGLWSFFGWGAFGGDVVDRNLLLTRALLQARERGIRPRSPGDVVVIGDTPYDVACAHSGGARAVAVATGLCSVDDLRATGAEVVLADLGDATAFLAAIE